MWHIPFPKLYKAAELEVIYFSTNGYLYINIESQTSKPARNSTMNYVKYHYS